MRPGWILKTMAAAAVGLSAAAFAPAAQIAEKWQAIAVRDDGRFTISQAYNAPTRDAARAEALGRCSRDGGRCRILVTTPVCGAVAYNEAEQNFFGAFAMTEAQAVSKAHAECSAAGFYCNSQFTACPFPMPR